MKKPFLDYVLFLDTPGNEALLAASNVQRGWRICKHCQTLFFARSKGLGGICPGVKGAYGGSNGPHVAKQFPKLAVMHDPDPLIKFFYFWRWCFHCEQLFDVGGSKSGVCPKGGIIHNGELSGYYQVPTGNVASLGY